WLPRPAALGQATARRTGAACADDDEPAGERAIGDRRRSSDGRAPVERRPPLLPGAVRTAQLRPVGRGAWPPFLYQAVAACRARSRGGAGGSGGASPAGAPAVGNRRKAGCRVGGALVGARRLLPQQI